jgi:hypothetical protein
MARAFDNRVAMFAMVLFLGSDLMWSLAISGLPMQFMIFLVCAAGFCVNEALTADETVEGEGMSALWLGVAAVMVGVLTLTRYSMLAIYLPFVALGWLGFTRRMACGLIATLVPLTLLLPWLVRNALVSGNLFGYAWVQLFAADSSLWRLYGGEADWYIGFNQLLRALLNGVGNCFANLGSFFGGLLAPGLFVLGFFHMFKRERVQIARWFWGGAFALLLGFNALTIKSANVLEQQDLNSLFVLFPILAGYGTAFACVLVERLQLPSRVLQIPVLTLVCLLQLYPLSLRLIQHRPPQIAYPPYVPPIMQVYYKQFLAPDELQTCDIPWAGAWYCNRLSLWMPQNREDFAKIGESVYPINAFWLTAASMNKNVRNGEYAAWSQLIELADTYQALRESPSEYKKAVAFSLLQTLGNDQPLPYFLPQRVAGTDHYYDFSNKRQVQELLQQAQGSR